MSAVRFDSNSITDQKRLVRGEHFLLARTRLRARDAVHNAKWRILTLAGGSPHGEIAAIRELMPKAFVVAVDKIPDCLDAAIDAGADDVVLCDLSDFVGEGSYSTLRPAEALSCLDSFDIINLDFCGPINIETRNIVRIYQRLLSKRGVMIVTFSYGRDVVEAFNDAHRKCYSVNKLREAGMPDALIGRLAFLLTNEMINQLRSAMLYRGPQMPMCSLLLDKSAWYGVPAFVRVEPGDFELAVVYPESANLYDCPRDRIEMLRRKFAAIKAAYTRSKRQPEPEFDLVAEVR